MSQYDEMSRWYDALAEGSEGKLRLRAIDMLCLAPGERVLEIGCGTGRGLVELARQAEDAQVVGVDVSAGMLREAQRRIMRIGSNSGIGIVRADGLNLPFPTANIDIAFLSFALELFEEDQREALMGEIWRVLRPGGRLGVVALAVGNNGLMERAYQWAHRRFPQVIDCRPIPLEREVEQAGWRITTAERHAMWGLPVAVVIASK